LNARRQKYASIVENDPSQAVFAQGWNNRLEGMQSNPFALPEAGGVQVASAANEQEAYKAYLANQNNTAAPDEAEERRRYNEYLANQRQTQAREVVEKPAPPKDLFVQLMSAPRKQKPVENKHFKRGTEQFFNEGQEPWYAKYGIPDAVMQGASMFFGDELQGAWDSAVGGVFGDKRPFKERYKENQQDRQNRYNAWAEENKAESLGGEITGGIIAGGGTIKSLQNLPAMLRYPLLGGAYGSVAGYGNADPSQRAEGTVKGAVGGAAFGTAIPLLGSGASALFRKVVSPAQSFATKKVTQALKRDGLTPKQVLPKLGHKEAMIPDVSGMNTTNLLDTIAQRPGAASNMVNKVLDMRQAGRNSRVMQSLRQFLGTDGETFYAKMESKIAERAAKAKPLYDKAYSVVMDVDDDLRSLLGRPSVAQAWEKAQRLAADEGHVLSKFMTMKNGKLAVETAPDAKTLDYIKRGLDDVIDGQTDKLTGKLTNQGRVVKNIKSELLSWIDTRNPAYKQARDVFADDSALLNALEKGRKFLRDDAEMTERAFKQMSQGEQEFFRQGAARALADKMRSAVDGADAYKRIMGNELLRDKVRALFPDEGTFKGFLKNMETEGLFARTSRAVQGNSKTASRQMLEADLGKLDAAARMGADVVTGNKWHFLSGIITNVQKYFAQRGLNDRSAGEIARILTAQGPLAKDAVNALMKQAPLLPPAQQKAFLQALGQVTAMQSGSRMAKPQPGLLSGQNP